MLPLQQMPMIAAWYVPFQLLHLALLMEILNYALLRSV